MKRIQALIAAVIITGLVGLSMLAIGVNAALNPNTVAVSDAPGSAPAAVSDPPNSSASAGSTTSAQAQAQVKQLQDLIAQYQNREKQYQAQLDQYQNLDKQYQAQVDQAAAQLQQYQALLAEMQRRGLIRINGDGSIQLPQRSSGGNDGG
jgi:peptidoglycan hydrolase CwlO-like protein